MRSLKHGSLRLEFIITALEQAANNPDIRALAVGMAGNLIIEFFKWLANRTPMARDAKHKEVLVHLRNPEIATALRDVLSPLLRDPVVEELEITNSKEKIKLEREELERAKKEVEEWAREPSSEERILWGKQRSDKVDCWERREPRVAIMVG